MKRRQVLKAVVAGSALSAGANAVAGRRPSVRQRDVEAVDALHVVEDDEVVETVEAPTTEDFDRLHAELGDDQRVVTPDGCCFAKCKYDCPDDDSSCDCCGYQCECWTCSDGTKVCNSSNC